VSRVSGPGSNFPLWCDIHRNHDSSDSHRRRQRSRYYLRCGYCPRARVYQIFDIRNSHLARGQVWRCSFTLTLALDTFGKSFRRNIIQRGVKLQPQRPRRTDISIDNVIPKRLWTDASCVYGYACTCRFRRPFRILTDVSRVDEAICLSLSLSLSLLSLSLSLCVDVGWDFFYFIRRAYQSPAATLRNTISIFRHRMENLVTTLRRSPFNGGIFNAIATNAPSERAAIARESAEMEFVWDRL